MSVNWAANLAVSLLTLSATEGLGGGAKGVAHLFLIFAGISLLSVVFIYMFVHETKGETLADSDDGDATDSGIATVAYKPLAEAEELPD